MTGSDVRRTLGCMNRRARIILLLGAVSLVAALVLWFGGVEDRGVDCGSPASPSSAELSGCDDAVGERREFAALTSVLAGALLLVGVTNARREAGVGTVRPGASSAGGPRSAG